MAELVVRTQDKVNPDSPYLDCKCTKSGDVVEVVPDGWAFSEFERTAPHYRFLRVKDMPIDEARSYMAREPGNPLLNKMLQIRQFKIDLASPLFTPAQLAVIADDRRAQTYVDMTADQLRAMKVAKTALADPSVIGSDPKVIG